MDEYRVWHEPSKTFFEWDDISINGRNNCVVHISEGVFPTNKTANAVILEKRFPEDDKNGNKIFVGDLLKSRHGEVFVLRFDKNPDSGQYCFYLENTEDDITTYKIVNGNKFEKIGTIHT